jgi:hypothetical protein
MINVENSYDTPAKKSLGEVDPGEAFIGVVEDVNGDEQTGVFVRTATGVVLLDDPTVEFESFDRDDTVYAPEAAGFRYADITVTVDSAD